MFGTRSIVITAVARSRASFARSRKVPAGAYTSIMGMLVARALDDPGNVLRPRDVREMPGRHGLPGRRDGEWLAERAAGDRLLRRRECARLQQRQAVGEDLGILRRVDIEKTGCVR